MHRPVLSSLLLSTMMAVSIAATETKPAAPAANAGTAKPAAPATGKTTAPAAPVPGKTTPSAAPAPAPAPKTPAPKAPQAEAPSIQADTVRQGIVLAGRWGGSAAFGVTHYSGDYGSGFGGIDGFGRVGLRWQPLEYLGARASAAYIRLHSTTGKSMRSDISMAEFDAVLQWPRGIFRPYLAGGPAIAHVSAYREVFGRPTDPDVNGRPKNVRDKVVFAVPAEIGLELLVSEDVSLFAFAGGSVYSGSDLLDGVERDGDGVWGDKDDYKTFGAGMTFWINPMRDRDQDGIVDRLDQCPSQPEDRDGHHDEDGCPEADNDRDGVSDLADKCPLQGEDYDGFQDEDGCPEADNDRDGVVDGKDRCPNDLEDLDGAQDEDGCPDLDNDRDGILDAKDRCPNEPEDVDGAQDEDGCPDLDNDQDGISDKMDRCPNEKEIVNGVADEDGCPDIGVMVGRSMVLEGIYFATNSAEILPESRPALEKAAESLLSLPEAMVEIRGYTDNVGNDRANQKLSQQRAESVRIFLVGLGVPAERITAKGFGRLNPIADNATEDGRAKNRRIEFYRVK